MATLNPIALHRARLGALSAGELELALRRIVCSVRYDLVGDAAMRLLGPEMSYHGVDPHLEAGLKRIRPELRPADILTFRSSEPHFDLCFEDSWTGYFMARRLAGRPDPRELVLIHLDDHTDMMATLLCRTDGVLRDPTSGETFDPKSASDWECAIHSGAVNIGNYITAWFYSGIDVHVRHLKETEDNRSCFVSRKARCYELIPGREFADIETTNEATGSSGTYVVGNAPEHVLKDLPRAWTLVHIDLDYFINDFNGASRGQYYVPGESLRSKARERIDRFFDALRQTGVAVDRWLIATSPGFCSAWHWEWLLAELRPRIERYQTSEATV